MSETLAEGPGGEKSHPPVGPIFRRIGFEAAPLLLFFIGYKYYDFMTATAIFIAAVVAVTGLSWFLDGRFPVLPAFSCAIALATGGLTLVLEDETFIMVRPTIINGLYGLVILMSVLVGRPLLAYVMKGALELDDAGWRGLSWMLALYLLFLAGLNEAIWRTQSTELWVDFKVFALIPLNILFVLILWPYAKRHLRSEDQA